jgi:salicylate hydroxylase
LLADGKPLPTGHLAFRGLVPTTGLPAWLREPEVTAWLGPKLHVVAYPVRRGELLNVVAFVEGQAQGDAADWDQAATAAQLSAATGATCAPLQELLQCVGTWRLWMLHTRPVVAGAHQMAAGRVALLGDAAHPMKPYLAQGAAMAIEDAQELSRMLAMADEARIEVPLALSRYALNRWQRCARVQARSERNGRVFHATGFVRAARDASLRLLGPALMDQPWLYRGISSQIGP